MTAEALVKQPIVWVDSNQHLEEVCERWQQEPMLALDTEFMRSRTYYPIAGLIQVNDGKSNTLIDPTTIDDFYPFVDILDDANILKVLHACSEDLEVFQHTFGCMPKNIFDTQVAGAFAGIGFSVGYANLVRQVLSVDIPKSETRSDWLQRPLSESQLRYAAIDVEYLFVLANKLIATLDEQKRLSWAMEDSQLLIRSFFENQDPNQSYLRFKSAWKLSARQLALLKKLSRWREDMAQEKDIPRNRLIKETALYAIAQNTPAHMSQLKKYEGMTERMVRSNGKKIIAMVSEAKALAESELPSRLPSPLSKPERQLLEKLKEAVASCAGKLAIPTESLVRKKDYEAMVLGIRNGECALPAAFSDWRKQLLGNELLTVMQQYQKK